MLFATIVPRAAKLLAFVCCLWGACMPTAAGAFEPNDIVKVEEFWEMVVDQPDVASNAPQVTCTISPVGHLNSHHAAFEINHGSQPSYTAGGLQLQVWNNEAHFLTRKHTEYGSLGISGETVKWTQSMRLTTCSLTFQVKDGTSSTWGGFGSGSTLEASVQTGLSNLNAYNPAVSVANSGIGFASNRVSSLVLRQVRYTKYNGEVILDTTPRQVYPVQ